MPRELGPALLYFDQASADRIPEDLAGHVFYCLLFSVTSELIASFLLIYLEWKLNLKEKKYAYIALCHQGWELRFMCGTETANVFSVLITSPQFYFK